MTDDLSTRLLEAIEKRRRAASEAAMTSPRWYSGPNTRGGYSIGEFAHGGVVWNHTDSQRSQQAHHIALNDPESVLRLCQAHREIVEEYLAAKQRRLEADAAGAGPHHVLREMDVERALLKTTRALATAYGIQEET